VVSTPLKNISQIGSKKLVSWDDYSQYMEKIKHVYTCSKPPTSHSYLSYKPTYLSGGPHFVSPKNRVVAAEYSPYLSISNPKNHDWRVLRA
jgi:hypothetical protein